LRDRPEHRRQRRLRDAVSRIFQTRLTALFGIRTPVLGGGLMWLSDARYAAAFARAGALAFITPRSYDSPEAFLAGLRAGREASGGRPVGVNVTPSRRRGENSLVSQWRDIGLDEGVRAFEPVGPAPRELFARIHAGGARVIHRGAFVSHALKAQDAGADA